MRYRQLRREVISKIVANLMLDTALQAAIDEAAKRVPTQDRSQFIANIKEDLALLSPIRSAGLGLSADQIAAWQRHYKNSPTK